MANRFDILINRIELQAQGRPPLTSPGDGNGAGRDRRHAKPVRGRKPLADKDRAEHRHQPDA